MSMVFAIFVGIGGIFNTNGIFSCAELFRGHTNCGLPQGEALSCRASPLSKQSTGLF